VQNIQHPDESNKNLFSTERVKQGLGKAGSADLLKFGAEVRNCIWRL